MDESVVYGTELAEVLGSVISGFYAQATVAPVAERLAALHRTIWQAALAGAVARNEMRELARQTAKLAAPAQTIDRCNEAVIWALTPVIAASLACGPGEEPIRLRDVAGALHSLLEACASAAAGDAPAAIEQPLKAA